MGASCYENSRERKNQKNDKYISESYFIEINNIDEEWKIDENKGNFPAGNNQSESVEQNLPREEDLQAADTQINQNKSHINIDNIIFKNKNENDIYDLVIKIESILRLKEGWEINGFGGIENQKRLKNIFENKKIPIISAIGNYNRGKTFLLKKISDISELELGSGGAIQTQGLSLKYAKDNSYLLLDTIGFNAPLLKNKNETIDENSKNNFTRGQVITNFLLQNFIIKEADILFCLIPQLTFSEQQFLNKIRNLSLVSGKKLFVVHNLYNLKSVEEIEKYINTTLKKTEMFHLVEKKIPQLLKSSNIISTYFVEEDKNEESRENRIIHVVLGNDKIEELNLYNQQRLEFLNLEINQYSINNERENIVDELVKFITEKSQEVLKTPIHKIFLERNVIKCDENLETKEIVSDELNNLILKSDKFIPNYNINFEKIGSDRCLIIGIEVCGNCEVDISFKKELKNFEFIIKGNKKVKQYKDSILFTEKRKFSDFKIEFSIDYQKYDFTTIYRDSLDITMDKGIIFFKYKIDKN